MYRHTVQDKSWKLGPEHLKLIDRTRDRVKMLHTIHTELSEKLFMFGGGPSHMAGAPRGPFASVTCPEPECSHWRM